MTTVSSGQTSAVSSGSPSGGWIVLSGGTLDVVSGGTISGAIDSGDITISSAGTAVGDVVLSGGQEVVGVSGLASSTTISTGGVELLFGGTAVGATITGNSANDTFVVYNSADVIVPKVGSHDIVYSAVNYTLPTGVDSMFLEGAATQAVGNSDAAGDTLYAANVGIAQTLTGHSHNDTFVVYNSGDTVVGQAGSTDTVYAAANF